MSEEISPSAALSSKESAASKQAASSETHARGKNCSICGKSFADGAPQREAQSSLPCRGGSCLSLTMAAKAGEQPLQLRKHESLCIFPFSFEEQDGASFRRLLASSRWKPRFFSSEDPEDIDRTEYFLPYVKKFLFPTLEEKAADYDVHAELARPTVQHFRLDLSTLGTLDQKARLPFLLRGEDDREKSIQEHPMFLEDVTLLVTNMSVGFLIFQLQRGGVRPTYIDQMNATLFFRLLAPMYRGFSMPEMIVDSQHFQIPQLLVHLLAEFSPDPTIRPPTSCDWRKHLPIQASYDDRMMVYTFSCIKHQTCLSDRERTLQVLERYAFSRFDDDLSTKPPNHPQEDETQQWLSQRWQTLSKEGTSLVAFDTSPFHREFLGTYHRTYYFDIFLLATLQRTALLRLFERLSDIRSLTAFSWKSQKTLRRLRKAILLFKNQSWFSQITHRERGLVLWRRWQRVFEVQALMQEVNEQSKELSTYLQDRARQQVEWGVRLGGLLGALLPAIFGLRVVLGDAPWVNTLRWGLALGVIAATAIVAYVVLFREED